MVPLSNLLIVVRSGRPHSRPLLFLRSTELPLKASEVVQVLYIQWYTAQCYTDVLREVG